MRRAARKNGVGILPELVLLQETLDTLAVDLRACEHLLQDELAERRQLFPRFYFLSDDEVVEVLSLFASCSHPVRTRGEFLPRLRHRLWRKMFQGVQQVVLRDADYIYPSPQPSFTVLGGIEEEVVLMDVGVEEPQSVPGEGGSAETWLASLDVSLKARLKGLTEACIRALEEGNAQAEEDRLLSETPSQVGDNLFSFSF